MPWGHLGGGSEGMAPPFLTSALDVSGQLQAPAALSAGISPRYPSVRRLRGPQGRSRRFGDEKNLVSAGIRTPAIQPVARSYTDGKHVNKTYSILNGAWINRSYVKFSDHALAQRRVSIVGSDMSLFGSY
jgi:hypothetical protein